jgi:hypothetical protein
MHVTRGVHMERKKERKKKMRPLKRDREKIKKKGGGERVQFQVDEKTLRTLQKLSVGGRGGLG